MQSPAIFGFASNSPDATRPPHPRRPFDRIRTESPRALESDRTRRRTGPRRPGRAAPGSDGRVAEHQDRVGYSHDRKGLKSSRARRVSASSAQAEPCRRRTSRGVSPSQATAWPPLPGGCSRRRKRYQRITKNGLHSIWLTVNTEKLPRLLANVVPIIPAPTQSAI